MQANAGDGPVIIAAREGLHILNVSAGKSNTTDSGELMAYVASDQTQQRQIQSSSAD
jgi:hypothetical protein